MVEQTITQQGNIEQKNQTNKPFEQINTTNLNQSKDTPIKVNNPGQLGILFSQKKRIFCG